MIVPTLAAFEKTLWMISVEAQAVVNRLYNEAKEKGQLHEDGQMRDVSAKGSTTIFLDRRKPLYKFLASIPYDPEKFYFVMDHGREVSINLRNVKSGQSYLLNHAAYDVVAKRLKEEFGWEVFNTVDID